MNKQEAAKLLALVKIAYPLSYRDMDDASIHATVNMWHMSFPDVPYAIMEQAFNQFRMVSKFPPTVAEMVEELRHIHFRAEEGMQIQKILGNDMMAKRFAQIMECTKRFEKSDHVELGGGLLPKMLGGENYGQTRKGLNSSSESWDDIR